MHWRPIGAAAAVLLGLGIFIPAATPAKANVCDTTCIVNQLEANQIPAQPTDGPKTFGPYGWYYYYTGPNGLEIRLGRDATWNVLVTAFALDTGAYSVGATGVVSSMSDLIVGTVSPGVLRGAASFLGLGTGAALNSIAQKVLDENYCLGITNPGTGVAAAFERAVALMSGNFYAALTTPPPPANVWFEPCSNEQAGGLADAASPQSLGFYSETPQAATNSFLVPISSVSGDEQMLVAPDASIYAKNSIGNGGWSQEVSPGNTTQIAVGGGTQMFLRGDSAVFARSAATGGAWIQETDPGSATKIAVSSTGVQMLIAPDSSIYAKNSIGYGGWTQEVGPGNATAIAVGGDTQMFIRGDSAVFAKTGIGNGGWVQETDPGTATKIAVSSTGVQMIIRSDSAIFAKNGIGYGGWNQEVGAGNATAIAVGGNTQMFIRGDSAVFAKSGIGNGGWVQETDPGNATAIAVSAQGDQMFLRGDSTVFAKNGIGYGGWQQETGSSSAQAIAAGG